MRDPGFRPEELDELLELSQDDPRVVEAQRSPKWRALMRAHREFIEGADRPPADADVADANARLDAFRAELVDDVSVAGPQEAKPSWLALIRSYLRPRPAWALAAVLIAAGAFGLSRLSTGPDPTESILRGDSSGATVQIVNAAPSRDGGWQLTWKPFPGADRYQVVLYSAELVEIARYEVAEETSLDVKTDDGPVSVYWRVLALAGERTIARSTATPLAQSR